MDKNQIDQALRTLNSKLPEMPKWTILLRRNGEFLSRVGELRNYGMTPIDDKAAALLIHTQSMSELDALDGLHHGNLQQSISIGSTGIYFLVHLNDAYLLGISFQSVGVRSIDAILKGIVENFFPLLEVLYGPDNS